MKTSGSPSAISLATRTEPFEPSLAGEKTMSTPYMPSRLRRSSEVFSGMTQVSL